MPVTHYLKPLRHNFYAGLVAVLLLPVATALAQSDEDAREAIARAEAQVELAQSQNDSSLSGDSYNAARERLMKAREALEDGNESWAVWYSQEAELFAELTIEKARLAAERDSYAKLEESILLLEQEARR